MKLIKVKCCDSEIRNKVKLRAALKGMGIANVENRMKTNFYNLQQDLKYSIGNEYKESEIKSILKELK